MEEFLPCSTSFILFRQPLNHHLIQGYSFILESLSPAGSLSQCHLRYLKLGGWQGHLGGWHQLSASGSLTLTLKGSLKLGEK